MKLLRHIITALAAQIPCKLDAQAAPVPVCDCGERFAEKARAWDEGLTRAYRKYGRRYSLQIGHA